MAFDSANLNAIVAGGGTHRASMWLYTTTDAHTDVDATDYFAGMGTPHVNSRGMRVNDLVFVIDTDTATCTLHYVSAVDSDGNVTIAAATLS